MKIKRIISFAKSRVQTGLGRGLRFARHHENFAARRPENDRVKNSQSATSPSQDPSVRRVSVLTGESAWLVTNYAQVKALFCDTRLQIIHPERNCLAHISNAAVEQCRPRSLRKLLTPSFSAHRMHGLRPRVQEFVQQALDDLEHDSKPADFHALVSRQVPARVICELLGIPRQDHEELVQWSLEASDLTSQERSDAAFAKLLTCMSRLINQKIQNPTADVLSDLVLAWKRDLQTISIEDLAAVATGLLFAGHQTTVASIDKGIVLLLRDHSLWQTLYSDPTLVPRACEEIFRLPLPDKMRIDKQIGGIARYSHADFQVGGHRVHKGDLVLLGTHGNVDPEVFQNPHTFDLTRKENPHLTFGHGAHYCLGAPLARIELQILIEQLVSRFPTLRLAVPTEELHWSTNVLSGGLEELRVTW